jgi:hypothetical protein
VAINPVTKSEVKLNPPVWLESWEDLDRFNDLWDDFCAQAWENGRIDPVEVAIHEFS